MKWHYNLLHSHLLLSIPASQCLNGSTKTVGNRFESDCEHIGELWKCWNICDGQMDRINVECKAQHQTFPLNFTIHPIYAIQNSIQNNIVLVKKERARCGQYMQYLRIVRSELHGQSLHNRSSGYIIFVLVTRAKQPLPKLRWDATIGLY